MNKITLLSLLVLSACYSPPKPSYFTPANLSPSQYKDSYEACVKQQAEALDDGTSPANVIGRSIADACNTEYIAYSMQIVAADNQAVQNTFYRNITNDRDLAAAGPTKYVLSRRNYLKTHTQ